MVRSYKNKARRKPYTYQEDKQIIHYIYANDLYNKIKGKAMWEDLSNEMERTWESLKERFLKTILQKLDVYNLPKEVIQIFKQKCPVADPRDRKNFYSCKEDYIIRNFIKKKEGERPLKGVVVWQELEKSNLLPGRTWQSLRNRYVNVLSKVCGSNATKKEAQQIEVTATGTDSDTDVSDVSDSRSTSNTENKISELTVTTTSKRYAPGTSSASVPSDSLSPPKKWSNIIRDDSDSSDSYVNSEERSGGCDGNPERQRLVKKQICYSDASGKPNPNFEFTRRLNFKPTARQEPTAPVWSKESKGLEPPIVEATFSVDAPSRVPRPSSDTEETIAHQETFSSRNVSDRRESRVSESSTDSADVVMLSDSSVAFNWFTSGDIFSSPVGYKRKIADSPEIPHLSSTVASLDCDKWLSKEKNQAIPVIVLDESDSEIEEKLSDSASQNNREANDVVNVDSGKRRRSLDGQASLAKNISVRQDLCSKGLKHNQSSKNDYREDITKCLISSDRRPPLKVTIRSRKKETKLTNQTNRMGSPADDEVLEDFFPDTPVESPPMAFSALEESSSPPCRSTVLTQARSGSCTGTEERVVETHPGPSAFENSTLEDAVGSSGDKDTSEETGSDIPTCSSQFNLRKTVDRVLSDDKELLLLQSAELPLFLQSSEADAAQPIEEDEGNA